MYDFLKKISTTGMANVDKYSPTTEDSYGFTFTEISAMYTICELIKKKYSLKDLSAESINELKRKGRHKPDAKVLFMVQRSTAPEFAEVYKKILESCNRALNTHYENELLAPLSTEKQIFVHGNLDSSLSDMPKKYFIFDGQMLFVLERWFEDIKKALDKKSKLYVPKQDRKKIKSGYNFFKKNGLVLKKHVKFQEGMDYWYSLLDNLIPDSMLKNIVTKPKYANHSSKGWNIYITNKEKIYIAVLHFANPELTMQYKHILTVNGLPTRNAANIQRVTTAIEVALDLTTATQMKKTVRQLKQAAEELKEFYSSTSAVNMVVK